MHLVLKQLQLKEQLLKNKPNPPKIEGDFYILIMTKEEFEYYVEDLNSFIVGTFRLEPYIGINDGISIHGYNVDLNHLDGFLSWELENFTFEIIIELIESNNIFYNPDRYQTWKKQELRTRKLKELGL